jgi:two-component system, response regulator PdtaR
MAERVGCIVFVAEAITKRREPCERVKVLLVEDEALIRLCLASELRGARYEVIEASNADEALEIVQTHPVDLMISDVVMPGSMDGVELAERARKVREDMKIIIVSGQLPQAPSQACADDYFTKPYGCSTVLRSCRELLDGRLPS